MHSSFFISTLPNTKGVPKYLKNIGLKGKRQCGGMKRRQLQKLKNSGARRNLIFESHLISWYLSCLLKHRSRLSNLSKPLPFVIP